MKLSRILPIFLVPLVVAFYGWNLAAENSFAFYHKNKTSKITTPSDGKVVINSPVNESEISEDNIELDYEIADRGKRGDHVHVFLDGELLGTAYGEKYKIKGLTKGEHIIEVKLASKSHVLIGPSAGIKIFVK